ncbi:MAG: GNAT family N-acetyltransferase [Solirubrobacterales bacterium]|nr:GNAT family N-acetyltransferase [Solirubrobacterales bacterium]
MPGASTGSTVRPRNAVAIDCHLAAGVEELDAHFELRRTVFVFEQRLFEVDDRDERDDQGSTLHAIGLVDGEPCGAVRLYPLGADGLQWKGDRLAVLPEVRTNHLGAALVRFAVSTAGRLGGARMIAHVQLPNVRFFEHLGWQREGAPASFHGVDHQLMSIGLDRGA